MLLRQKDPGTDRTVRWFVGHISVEEEPGYSVRMFCTRFCVRAALRIAGKTHRYVTL